MQTVKWLSCTVAVETDTAENCVFICSFNTRHCSSLQLYEYKISRYALAYTTIGLDSVTFHNLESVDEKNEIRTSSSSFKHVMLQYFGVFQPSSGIMMTGIVFDWIGIVNCINGYL